MISELYSGRGAAPRSPARRRWCKSRPKCCARACANCSWKREAGETDSRCDYCEGAGESAKASDIAQLVRAPPVNSNLMIAILRAKFHGTESVCRVWFAHLLGPGPEKVQ